MTSNVANFVAASFVAFACAACAALDRSASPADSDVGTAEGPLCGDLYVDHLVTRQGKVLFVTPDHLATSGEGWGPQVLSLTVDQGFAPQVSYEESPSISLTTDNISRSLSKTAGISLSESTNLAASTSVAVPTGAYYSIEAYPEYQVIDWQLFRYACFRGQDLFVTTGTVYRPIGVYFRVLAFVGAEWNVLTPESPYEAPLPPGLAGQPVWRAPAAPKEGEAEDRGDASSRFNDIDRLSSSISGRRDDRP